MRSSMAVIAATVTALGCVACKKNVSDAPGGSGSAAASGGSGSAAASGGSGTATGAGADDGEVLPPAAAVDEAGARKLVDAWLAAQNSGDLPAYEAVYAAKLEGIKRVGARTWRFDRAGWLADRKRMFKHPMTVAVRDVTVRGGATAATVDFVQTFSQGKFKDEGPKHLVLVRGPSGFQIAREEMLRSDVGGPAANGKASAYVVLVIDKQPYVVIAADADEAWGTGRPRGPFEEMHKLATMDASKAPMAATWAGRAMKVFAHDGTSCDATVGALKLVAGGTPHFGEVQIWNGDPNMSDDGRTWSAAERTRAVWGLSTPYLVAQLTVSGACQPVIAVDPASAAVVFAPVPATAPDPAAVAAFRKLPAYADLQRDFTETYEGKGEWATEPAVVAHAAGGRRFVVVSATEGSGCGEFLGQLSVIFEDKSGTLTPVPGPDGFLRVDLIVDTDGDGAIEVVGAIEDYSMVTGHFVPAAGSFTPAIAVSFPNNDCGC